MTKSGESAFRRVLIANRGEIARRIIKTCRKRGLETVAVYSSADQMAAHVREADITVPIGAAPSSDSYLNIDAILKACQSSGADAVHPGYGFLSERADFARAVAKAGLVFIGPPAACIDLLGDKARAKTHLSAHNIPLVPGYSGADQSDETLLTEAKRIGFPVMLKAAAGGGGRGMRLVDSADTFGEQLTRARTEANSAFGDARLIVEKAITKARHIEVQVFGDRHGNLVHLFERDCTLQRRHQKLIEEAPAPSLAEKTRRALYESALKVARAVDYTGAGTVEFLVTPNGAHYFLEMNTRLQVEHPVTEQVTGLDLVDWQLRVAAGEPLPLTQKAITRSGHSVEARIYLEDPGAQFLPAPGPVHSFGWVGDPGSAIRLDSAIIPGEAASISPHYDPMVAKVIAYGQDARQAYARLAAALAHLVLDGTANNITYLQNILQRTDPGLDPACHTGWLEQANIPATVELTPDQRRLVALAAYLAEADSTAQPIARFSADPNDRIARRLMVDGTALDAEFKHIRGGLGVTCDGTHVAYQITTTDNGWLLTDTNGQSTRLACSCWGSHLRISINDDTFAAQQPVPGAAAKNTAASPDHITAPMHGLLVSINVSAGDRVRKGDTIAVLEAMKMQHSITADEDGEVADISARAGAQVARGDLLVQLAIDE